ncbi:hypothetical protein BH24CHL4_BH24CHL4_01860 [soil metagenome]
MMFSDGFRVAQHQSNRRVAVWLALVAPLLIYLLVFPVKARLDKNETEQHFAPEIWRAMGNALPNVGVDWLLELAFVAGGITFVFGVLCLIWMALDDAPANASEQLSQAGQDYGPLDDESSIPSRS